MRLIKNRSLCKAARETETRNNTIKRRDSCFLLHSCCYYPTPALCTSLLSSLFLSSPLPSAPHIASHRLSSPPPPLLLLRTSAFSLPVVIRTGSIGASVMRRCRRRLAADATAALGDSATTATADMDDMGLMDEHSQPRSRSRAADLVP